MPVLVALIVVGTRATAYAAVAVFVIGALSDGLDGYLARRHGMSTRTGAWLDPLSDKLFVAAPVLTLAVLGEFPWWGAAVIVVREVAVSLLRVYLGVRGVSMPASDIAKIKTGAQLAAITLYLWPLPERAGGARLAALVIAVVVTVYSGLDYFIRARTRPAEGAR